jgi:hypothetical protein
MVVRAALRWTLHVFLDNASLVQSWPLGTPMATPAVVNIQPM